MIEIESLVDLDAHEERVRRGMSECANSISSLTKTGIELLATMKFCKIAPHPLLDGVHLTLNEHLNQAFTNMVIFQGCRAIVEQGIQFQALRLRTGATPGGFDIVDTTGVQVAAECFAGNPFTIIPRTKKTKLLSDIARLSGEPIRHRFVFFYHPDHLPGRQLSLESDSNVQVWSVELHL